MKKQPSPKPRLKIRSYGPSGASWVICDGAVMISLGTLKARAAEKRLLKYTRSKAAALASAERSGLREGGR